MLTFSTSGSFKNTDAFLQRAISNRIPAILARYGEIGVQALEQATPTDTGETAHSWAYVVTNSKGSYSLTFTNSNIVDGVPIAIIIQYGHGTKNGGYVQGRDYINPVIQPIFDRITRDIWTEVTK